MNTRVFLAVLALSLCGCQTTGTGVAGKFSSGFTAIVGKTGAWVSSHEPQFKATADLALNKAVDIAETVVMQAAVSQFDAKTKGNFFDSAAQGLREKMTSIVSGDDVANVIKIWTPASDGPEHWTELATQLAKVYTDSHPTDSATSKAVVEAIAEGLQKARANAEAAAAVSNATP